MSRPKTQPKKSQVRIIGGTHKRRLVDFYAINELRPTPDRLRETLFNWLTADLFAANVLDVCAGSGVLGFECLSRGANHAVLIEANKQQAQCLSNEAQRLNFANKVTIHHNHANTILQTLNTNFDIVFIDPPYHKHLWQPILQLLLDHHLLKQTTLIYLEACHPFDHLLPCRLSQQFDILKSIKVGQIFAYLLTLAQLSPAQP